MQYYTILVNLTSAPKHKEGITLLKFERKDDERGKVVDIKEPYGLIKHGRWPSLAEIIHTASQQFPEISTEQLALIFYTDQHGTSQLQIYKRGC